MAKRPGIMLYFSVRPALKRLSAEQKVNFLTQFLTTVKMAFCRTLMVFSACAGTSFNP